MPSGHGVPKPRRENEPSRQVHRDRFPLYGGSADAMVATYEARLAGEQLAQVYTPFKSFNNTRDDKHRWPGEGS